MNIQTVTIRGLTLGDGIPKICVPVTASDLSGLEKQIKRIQDSPFDMVEWRADYFRERECGRWYLEALKLLRAGLGEHPLLFTFRTKEEGGERSLLLSEYESLALEVADSRMADLIDIEWNRGGKMLRRITDKAHAMGCRVIGSFHDFDATRSREETIGILTAMQDCGVDITKAAMMPRTEQDVLELLEASLAMKTHYADRPYITMSMGRLGAVSRLAGTLTGSALTFATAGSASAPGQLEAETLARILPSL